MTSFTFVGDMLEENGKTVKENNLEKNHKIPIGTLVEVKHEEWHGNGACEKIHARKFVVEHSRDCDGTPLYYLANKKKEDFWPKFQNKHLPVEEEEGTIGIPAEVVVKIMNGVIGGFTEESLMPIEMTERIKEGHGSLIWE